MAVATSFKSANCSHFQNLAESSMSSESKLESSGRYCRRDDWNFSDKPRCISRNGQYLKSRIIALLFNGFDDANYVSLAVTNFIAAMELSQTIRRFDFVYFREFRSSFHRLLHVRPYEMRTEKTCPPTTILPWRVIGCLVDTELDMIFISSLSLEGFDHVAGGTTRGDIFVPEL